MSDRDDERREPRLREFARRLLREGEDVDRRSDARDVLGAVLDAGDKAKTGLVRLVAREVRGYLEALEIHKDLQHLLTNYSLDIHANISLKPLARAVGATDAELDEERSTEEESVELAEE